MQRTTKTAALLTTLALALAACGQQTVRPSAPGPVVLQTVTVKAPFASSSLRPQALPGGEGGAPVVNLVKVKVKDASGNFVKFTADNVYSQSGDREYIALTPGTQSANLLLPRGEYTFVAIGKTDHTEAAKFMAYGETKANLSGGNPTVNLGIHTLTDMATFTPSVPRKYTHLGDITDVRTNVYNNVNGTAVAVPTSDYEVTYTSEDSATILGESKLGVRIRAEGKHFADGFYKDVRVLTTITAWVETGPEVAKYNTYATRSFSMPISTTSIGADLVPPAASLDSVKDAYVGVPLTLSGTASDDFLRSVEVYNGSTLIGSTMDKEIERQTQGSPVRFMHDKAGQLTSRWVMEYTPEEVGTLELTVLTRDDAGNETRTTQNVEVATPPVEQYTDARPLTLGVQSDTGRLSPDNRYDWYSIDMVEGQAYTVDMVSMGVYADSFDTLMALYDTDGTSALVSDDDSGDEDNSRIAFTAPSTGTYYLQATSRGHARNGALPTGSYHVLVTRNEQAPDPEACPTSVPTDGQYRRFTLNAGAECWIQVDASAHNFADTSLYFTTNNPGNYYPDFKSRVMAELHLGSKEGTLVPLDEGLEHSAYRLPASPTYWVRVWNVSEAAMPMGIVSGPMFWLN